MELLAANPSQVISTDRNVKIKAARGQGYYLEIHAVYVYVNIRN